MDGRQTIGKTNVEKEIDIAKILQALWKNAALILFVGILFSAAAFLYARIFVSPKYQANVLLYVNSNTVNIGTTVKITSSDLRTSSDLVDTYVAIMQSRANMELVIEKSGVHYNYETLRSMVSASAVNSTGLFRITVTSSNPEEARLLANVIAEILPSKIEDIMMNNSIAVVDYAVTPKTRVSPNYFSSAARGLLVGVMLAAAVVALLDYLNDVIRDEDYLLQNYDAPVLASVPDLRARSSKRYGYGNYGSYGSYGGSSGDARKKTEAEGGAKA